MVKRKITVVVAPTESGGFFAIAPFFPGVRAQGATFEDAVDGVLDVAELILAGGREEDLEALETAYKPDLTIREVEVEVPSQPSQTSSR
jgi:predicted RNase H-like HicB family nuclease